MDVLVNQLGYELGSKPTVVLRGTQADDPGELRVERASDAGAVVGTTEAELAGPVDDWRDWVFWTAECPALEEPGEYVVAVESDDVVRSRRFTVGADLLRSEALPDLLSYFRVERCTGPYDRADRNATFAGERDDAVDVSGGWYDASGDVSKYLSHLNYANYMNPQQIPLVVWSLLDAAERFDGGDRYEAAVGEDDAVDGEGAGGDAVGDDPLGASLAEAAREEARFGADFLVRAQDDAGYFYVTVFDGWTGDPDEREICAFEGFDGERSADYEAGFRQGGGVAIAALARASRSAAGSPDAAERSEYRRGEFGDETYLDAAVTGFEHLQERNEAYLDDGRENLLDDYCALLAATELAAATGERRFVDSATDRVKAIVAHQTSDGWFAADDAGERPFVHATDEGLPIVALCRFLAVIERSDAPGPDEGLALREAVRDAIVEYWRFELDLTNDVVNPFGYARQYAKGVDDAEPRARFFMPQDNETGYWWLGENARLGSLATAALSTLETFDSESSGLETVTLDGDGAFDPPLPEALRTFASDQLDWILGRNPFDTSMFQGAGTNPRPFVPDAPQTPGGIVNGVTAGVDDESEIAFLPDEYAHDYDHTWRWTEQWLPHAAWFLLAGTRIADAA